ncbi:MAG: hypothetical protein IJ620_05450 [Bacteroidales bacterium]|nr:hypothetical protein [Bacteroidales bacterium]
MMFKPTALFHSLCVSLLFFILFAHCHVEAQVPQAVTYQAVVRDATGQIAAGRTVSLRLSIMQGGPAGTAVYVERHRPTTNMNGLYTVLLGQGTADYGFFSNIDWAQGPYFILSEIDLSAGNNYTISGSQQLLSVPYAFLADSALHYAERQVIWRSNDTVFLTGGSFVVLPAASHIDTVRIVDTLVVFRNSFDTHYLDSLHHAAMAARCFVSCATVDSLRNVIRTYDSVFRRLIVQLSPASVGAIPGRFTVDTTGRRVLFSKGNLQYQASTDTWRFAEHQYDYIGNAVGNTTPEAQRATQSDWIDLFGWGTSGYHDAADATNLHFRPYDTAYDPTGTPGNDYGYGPAIDYQGGNLTSANARYDWGVANPIANGGNMPALWRMLTTHEWRFILSQRSTTAVVAGISNARYAKVKVNGANGVVLFPDEYSHPSAATAALNPNQTSSAFVTLSADEWAQMEAAGAVFLPAAGNRLGSTVYDAGTRAYYWSSTHFDASDAYGIFIQVGGFSTSGHNYRNRGNAVRLVYDVW